jgi:hypothetical protein
MKTLTTILFFLGALICCDAQLPHHSWSYSWGSSAYDVTSVLAVDRDANVYVAGYFKGTVDFDPGPGSATFTTGLGGFINETYVSKFDSSGHFLWVKHIATDVECITRAMVYDPAGFIYISGYYEGQGDFDPGTATHTMTSSSGSDDNFIVKFDLDGNFVWATSIGGSGDEYGKNIALDKDGHVLIAGSFKGTCDFDPGPGQFIISSKAQLADLFVAEYSAGGIFLWAKTFLGSNQGDIFGLGTDHQANVFVTGVFDDRRDFDPGPDSVTVMATGFWDSFLVKLDASGNFQWMHHLGNDSEAWALDLALDKEDNVHVTGYFSGSLDFDPGPESKVLNAILDDGFVWKLDPDGNLIWVAQLGGVSYDEGRSIALDKNGNVYTSGFYAETLDFDPGPGVYNLTSTGNNDKDDAFISKLNKNGEFEWAYTLGGKEDDLSGEARMDSSGNVYITGSFQGKGGFYPEGTAPDSLVSNGSNDIFLTRWNQCLETYEFFGILTCQSYTSPSGHYVWTESGTYLDTIQNVAGCDSIITIELTISDLALTVHQEENTLVGDGAAGQFYWVDCDHNNQIVAQGNVFTPSVNGHYALVGIGFICSDTSACFSFVMTGIGDENGEKKFRVFPNPAHHSFNIDFDQVYPHVDIALLDQFGRKVYGQSFSALKTIPVSVDLPAGLYFLSVGVAGHVELMKVLMQ